MKEAHPHKMNDVMLGTWGILHEPLCLLTLGGAGSLKAQLFKTGERIPETGVYRVIHAAHRLPHECTLIEGQNFPRCCKCGEVVEFECIATAPNWEPGPTRTIILYELPELSPDEFSTPETA